MVVRQACLSDSKPCTSAGGMLEDKQLLLPSLGVTEGPDSAPRDVWRSNGSDSYCLSLKHSASKTQQLASRLKVEVEDLTHGKPDPVKSLQLDRERRGEAVTFPSIFYYFRHYLPLDLSGSGCLGNCGRQH